MGEEGQMLLLRGADVVRALSFPALELATGDSRVPWHTMRPRSQQQPVTSRAVAIFKVRWIRESCPASTHLFPPTASDCLTFREPFISRCRHRTSPPPPPDPLSSLNPSFPLHVVKDNTSQMITSGLSITRQGNCSLAAKYSYALS